MKLTPKQIKIQERMAEGKVTIDGFLGNDPRPYPEIIEDDLRKLSALDKTQEEIADRLQYFTDKAFESYDGPIVIDKIYKVEYKSYRGKMISPFLEVGRFSKGEITLENLENKIKIHWTPLSIHMIRVHGFFEGKGSGHRMEPDEVVKAVF